MTAAHIQSRKVKKKRATGISPECRKLLRATIRRAGSLRKAAKILRLPSHAQIPAMLEGRIGETAAMKAAVLRAEARAQRAFLMEPSVECTFDREQIKKLVEQIREQVAVLENTL